jgi:hypothetical protein
MMKVLRVVSYEFRGYYRLQENTFQIIVKNMCSLQGTQDKRHRQESAAHETSAEAETEGRHGKIIRLVRRRIGIVAKRPAISREATRPERSRAGPLHALYVS